MNIILVAVIDVDHIMMIPINHIDITDAGGVGGIIIIIVNTLVTRV